MAYLKPPLPTRAVFNKLAMRFGIGGSVTLTVAGRRTGEPRSVPVIPVGVDGHRYLVCPRGEAEWVRNLRAAGGCGELRRGQDPAEPFQAVEIPVAERPAIITAYRAKAGRTVEAYFQKLPDPEDHPTFRVEPLSG